jgi:hypothetical protein
VFVALGFGRGGGGEAREKGERGSETRGYEPFDIRAEAAVTVSPGRGGITCLHRAQIAIRCDEV